MLFRSDIPGRRAGSGLGKRDSLLFAGTKNRGSHAPATGFVIDHSHYSVAYLSCGAFTLAAFALSASGALRSLPTGTVTVTQRKGSPLQLLRDRELRRLYIVGILLAAAWDLFTFVTPIRGSQLGYSASTIGMILATFAAATFVVRLAMPGIVRRYREWQILTVALSLAAFCYLLFPFTEQPLALAATTFVLGLALGSGQPNVLALLHLNAPPGRSAEAIGIRATIGNASSAFLPLAFGAAGAAVGLLIVFWGLGAIIACGVPLAARKAISRAHTPADTQTHE